MQYSVVAISLLATAFAASNTTNSTKPTSNGTVVPAGNGTSNGTATGTTAAPANAAAGLTVGAAAVIAGAAMLL